MNALEPNRSEEHLAVTHLSENQLDELLMEIAEPEVVAHAAACLLCQNRLQEFQSSVAEFNQASLAWSEARSNTLSRDLRAHRLSPRLSRTSLWSCVSAGAVATVLLITAGVEHRTPAHEVAYSLTAGGDYAGSRQQEIASDNEMLAAISSEIDRPTPAPSTLKDEGLDSQPRRSGQARD